MKNKDHLSSKASCLASRNIKQNRQTDRQKDRQKDRQTQTQNTHTHTHICNLITNDTFTIMISFTPCFFHCWSTGKLFGYFNSVDTIFERRGGHFLINTGYIESLS